MRLFKMTPKSASVCTSHDGVHTPRIDIDLDGDGQFDALSAAFSFEAVRAVILRDSACVP